MIGNRKLKVFLCHSKDDKPKVRKLNRRLIADGFDAWLDEEKLMPGQDWDLEIRKAVRESDVVVVCLSNGSVTKAGYVQKEIRFALDLADEQPEGTVFIIPARLEDCQVPSRLTKWQWVNLFEAEGLKKLKLSLNSRANALGVLSIFIEPQMVKIPAGKFLMGSTDEQAQAVLEETNNYKDGELHLEWEQPQHMVELSEYSISKFPITNREYQAFVRDAKHKSPLRWYGDQFPVEKGGHPVVNVSWNDVIAYCKWLSEKSGKQYRLPTEAEWEKAARGKDGRVYPWGNRFDSQNANTSEARIDRTSEVGQFSPRGDSPYGCADMAGNVWEWCNDWFDDKEYRNRKDIVRDPQGPQKGASRVLRGGSFNLIHRVARCAVRLRYYPFDFYDYLGFRVVVSPIIKSEI
jgi:formylglycine-generating enzyme required for sulfatase activity